MNDERGQVPGLPPKDARLLDALIEAGFDADALDVAEPDRDKARTFAMLFQLLEDYPVEDADPALVDATMARIDRAESGQASRMRLSSDARMGARRLLMPDFITVAAVLLIGASIVLPVMHQLRQRSIDMGCENNMRVLGYAFSQYANDYEQQLPVARAGLNQTWSRFASNVLNLGPMLDLGYCEHDHLCCPGHDGPGDSYSYQWQAPGARVRWETSPGVIVLGDRNPLIDAIRAGRSAPATMISPNHGGRGQNVLKSDGSPMWLTKPVVGRSDNIWLPGGYDELVDGAEPSDPLDVFLAQ
jgi:hypothetical protein